MANWLAGPVGLPCDGDKGDVIVSEGGTVWTLKAAPGGEPVGAVKMWLTAAAPTGYLLCNGAIVSRATYADLFAVLGTTYGVGDGSTTFGLPDLRGRAPVGLDAAQTEFDSLGKTGGAKTVTLGAAEMPSHTHAQDAHGHTQDAHNHTQNAHTHVQDAHQHGMSEGQTDGAGTFMDRSSSASATTAVTNTAVAVNQNATATNQAATATNQATVAVNQSAGGGEAHANLPPYLALNFIVKT